MYVIKNMKNKQKEWHPATKTFNYFYSIRNGTLHAVFERPILEAQNATKKENKIKLYINPKVITCSSSASLSGRVPYEIKKLYVPTL